MKSQRMIYIVPAIALGLSLSVCQTAFAADAQPSVTADQGGFKSLGNRDYEASRAAFEAAQASSPHDPYLALDLGASYQGLGRQDLADALYRQAMVDGKDIRPPVTTFERDKGKTIAEIACENIGIGNKSGSCEVVAMLPPPPPAKAFIVFFDFNKTDVTADGHTIVAEAVKTAKAEGATKVLVTGHTDTVGSDSYNQDLSIRRAEAVKGEMVGGEMAATEISTDGKGFHDPLVATGPGVREPQNRRAVIDLGS